MTVFLDTPCFKADWNLISTTKHVALHAVQLLVTGYGAKPFFEVAFELFCTLGSFVIIDCTTELPGYGYPMLFSNVDSSGFRQIWTSKQIYFVNF